MRHGTMRILLAFVAFVAANRVDAGGNGCTNCAPATPAVLHGVGTAANCGDCGPTVKRSAASRANNCNNADVRFIFGTSKCFFAPCQDSMGDLFGGTCNTVGRKRPCSTPVYGSGIGQTADNCKGPATYMGR